MKAILVASCAAFIALGCQKSEPPAPLAASAAPATSIAPVASAAPVATVDPAPPVDTAAAAAPAAAPAAVAKAVPAETDYEVHAQTTITPANAAQVLAAIDQQVGK